MVCCSPAGQPIEGRSSCPFACPTGTSLRASRLCELEDEPVPLVDAGSPTGDAGLTCPAVRADYTCLESFLIEPEVPFALPLSFDVCGCCAQAACNVEVAQGARTLRVETTLCPDPCDCGVCVTPEVECAVPGLEAGEWNVVVNGAPAFILPVFPDSGFAPPPPACVAYAEADACRLSAAPVEAIAWRPDEVCMREVPWEGGWLRSLTASSECWACGALDGPCQVSLETRFTTDLPLGGEIRLATTHHSTECDVDCPAVCTPHEQRCIVPPLTDGHYYRVWLDGAPILSFVAGEAGRICSSDG